MDYIKRLWRENWAFVLFMAGLGIAWLFLHTPGTDLASTDEFDQYITAGQPVLVEFYSNT